MTNCARPEWHDGDCGPLRVEDLDPTVSVNDEVEWMWASRDRCWICGVLFDHRPFDIATKTAGEPVPHGEATGDGLTRFDIVALMSQGGYTWRGEA